MVGNFYISSSDHNDDSVYNSIFGNTLSEDKNSVTVNFLDGYGLADNSKTLLRQVSATLGDSTESNAYYVIGWLGGNAGKIILCQQLQSTVLQELIRSMSTRPKQVHIMLVVILTLTKLVI